MSVTIIRAEGNHLDNTRKLHFSRSISSEAFYMRCWSKAVEETGSKLFRDSSDFEVSDLEQVMSELKSQLAWAEANLTENDLYYMKERIEHLLECIPKACEESDLPFQIY